MFLIHNLLLILVGGRIVLGRNGCRQCTGYEDFNFEMSINRDTAETFFEKHFTLCATGHDYNIIGTLSDNCDRCYGDVTYCEKSRNRFCKRWIFNVEVWRYCGNGKRAYIDRGAHCSFGQCLTANLVEMLCYHSVECKGDCVCKFCGC